MDAVITALMKNVDRVAIRENLDLTPEQRLRKLQRSLKEKERRETVNTPSMLRDEPAIHAHRPESLLSAEAQDSMELVIQTLMLEIDRTLIRENLKLTPEQRLRKLQDFMETVDELHRAGEQVRCKSNKNNEQQTTNYEQ